MSEIEVSEIEVLDIVIQQIGELRVPVREKELLDGLEVVLRNLTALRNAVDGAQKAQESKEETGEVEEHV